MARAPTHSPTSQEPPSGRDQFAAFERIFQSPRLFGSGAIVKNYLRLPAEHVLPMTIPHGIDTYINAVDLDLMSPEPLYLAMRADISERMSKIKQTILFPHPWFLMDEMEPAGSAGTLFVAPPPSIEGFEQMYQEIERRHYPKPWGILLKDRGLEAGDFDWWGQKGFAAHSAGSIYEPAFFYNLRKIFSRYELIASPNMSSAVVFAAALGKRATAIPDVNIELLDVAGWRESMHLADPGGRVRQTWMNLLSEDVAVAQQQARDLMGYRYLDSPEGLRERYLEAVARLDRKVYLHPLRNRLANSVATRLISSGVAVDRLFPHPASKLASLLLRPFRRNRLTVVRGSDFAHFGIAGTPRPLEVMELPAAQLGAKPQAGGAVRR
jgi:hypothetical protein